MRHVIGAFALVAALAGPAMGQEADPLQSGLWDRARAELFGDESVVFDERVAVLAPAVAEDNLNVPVVVDARALGRVETLVLFADANPILRIAGLEPVRALPFLGLSLKMEQGGPVRAAARTPDGVWHVGGVHVAAAGGGCTAPASVHAAADWSQHLGELWGRAWPEPEGVQRVRLRAYHPMDTGLAFGHPAFFVDEIEIADEAGGVLARIEPGEPVSQHPVMTLLLRPEPGTRALRVSGRDIDGNTLEGSLPLAWRASALDAD
jgi:sulfur-oxidizing protein SoxY